MNADKASILLVDDDQTLLELLAEYLRGEGFDVCCEANALEALQVIGSGRKIDALVLDIMMPDLSGLELLKRIRQNSDLPVIMLTGRGDDLDRILGLELGADDYLGKPCNPRELSARIKAVLRRSRNTLPPPDGGLITVGQLSLDSRRLKAAVNGEAIPLTGTEFRVLHLLAQHLGEPLSKETLTETVLNRKLGRYDRSMDVHISRLRQKLGEYDELTIAIQAVRGIGYQLTSDEPDGSDEI